MIGRAPSTESSHNSIPMIPPSTVVGDWHGSVPRIHQHRREPTQMPALLRRTQEKYLQRTHDFLNMTLGWFNNYINKIIVTLIVCTIT